MDRMKANSDKTSPVKEIRRCSLKDFPKYVSFLSRQLVVNVVKAEAKARIKTHDVLLSGSRSLDNHYQNLVDICQLQPSQTPDVLTDMLTRVCHIMATEDPLFAFRPVGIGSHHDGTKVSRRGDLDFVLLSLYRPRENSVDRPWEDSINRPREDSIYQPREDSMDRPREDYRVECVFVGWHQFSVFPVEGSDFHRRCVERGLVSDRRRLDISQYRRQLSDKLSSVMSAVCSELGLPFGGWNRPNFGHFEQNGPAWTVLVGGVSVDITVAFTAPRDIMDGNGRKVMEEIAERVSSSVSSTVSEEERSDFVNMGLLVLTHDKDCQLSTSLLEKYLFGTVPELHSALKICKVYRDQFFDLPWPDLTPFFSYLESRVFEWLVSGGCDILLEAMPRRSKSSVVDQFDRESKALLLLATQRRPLTLDGSILEKLEEIKQRISKMIDYNLLYPSLRSLALNESPKPIAKTISFVFKSFLLDQWLEDKTITTQTLVVKVMEEYSRRLERNITHRHHSFVINPLLSSACVLPVVPVKSHSFFDYNYFTSDEVILSIHHNNVRQILSQIRRHTPVTDLAIDHDYQLLQQRIAACWRYCCCCFK